MILTGSKIKEMREAGHITLEPYDEKQVNPNSYNYRLGPQLGVPVLSAHQVASTAFNRVAFNFIDIPKDGYILEPGKMYLGHTLEQLGSDKYAMRLIGRSSIGRLGLFLQVSADLGHTGSSHQWTLEIVAAKPIKIYPEMKIGQISFWKNDGDVAAYTSGYSRFSTPQPSNLPSPK